MVGERRSARGSRALLGPHEGREVAALVAEVEADCDYETVVPVAGEKLW